VGLERIRWETAWKLNRAEFGYAEHYLKKLLAWLDESEFRGDVVGSFNECDFKRVEDLLKHRWPGEK
jgi:hypothetical protein